MRLKAPLIIIYACALSPYAAAHFAAPNEGTLRFTDERGYFLLTLPRAALANHPSSGSPSLEQAAQSCFWMTDASGEYRPLEGVLISEHSRAHGDGAGIDTLTVLGVFRGVSGAMGEALFVRCHAGGDIFSPYSVRISSAAGPAWKLQTDHTQIVYPVTGPSP